MEKFDVLLIDDDQTYCKNFRLFTEAFFNIRCAHDGKTALALLEAASPDIVFLDYWLGRQETGLDVLKKIRDYDARIPVVMISERTSVEVAVEAMKLGAYHYTSKFGSVEELLVVVHQELERLRERILWERASDAKYDPLLGNSPAMAAVAQQIRRYASVDSTVLITGESGAGKELAAWEIHKRSARRGKPFVAVNCCAVPESLFESQFFGHEPNAFTGARDRHLGYFEMASGGTLFLDEIGALPLALQAKLLRALETHTIRRVGGDREIGVDVRVVAAANQDLKQAVDSGALRRDLYHRLNVLPLHIPPLRQRPEDVPALAEYFLNKFAVQVHGTPATLTPEDLEVLQRYPWPGNVRELKNTLERYVVLGANISLASLLDTQAAAPDALVSFEPGLLDLPYAKAREQLMQSFRRYYFTAVIERFHGNVTKAAEWMDVPRTTVYRALRATKEKSRKD